MKLFDYKNLRTGQTHEGAPSRSNKNCLSLRAQIVPDLLPGDVLTLPSGQRAITVEIDHTGISCPRPRLRHCKAYTVPVTGQLTVFRSPPELNAFGRPVSGDEQTVLSAVPAHLEAVKELFPEGSEGGFEKILLRYQFLALIPIPIRAGDRIVYSADGAEISLQTIGTWPVASDLWQIRCLAV